jgi:hypothetical protein
MPVIRNLILAFVLVALWPAAAVAAGEVFTVRNIAVDATAAGAAEAREIAIAEGQRVAFDRLVHRLTRKQDWGFAPQVSAEQVTGLVLGIEVAEERTSATHYIGKITYSFRPAALRQFLKQSGIPFSEARAKTALLLPVLDTRDGLHLWDDPNPWRTAWARRDLADELVPVLVPLNDLEDSVFINAFKAANATWPDVAAIAEKYGLDRVLIARATARGKTLDVRITQLSPTQTQTSVFNFAGGGDLNVELDQAVDSALDRLYEEWKSATIVVYGQENTILASIWFSNLADWLTIQRRLGEAPAIGNIEIIGLSPQGAEVRLTYAGTIDQLRVALEQISLVLTDRGGFWEIAMVERSAAPASNGIAPPVPPDTGNTN